MIIEINTPRANREAEEESFRFSSGDSGSESPRNRLEGTGLIFTRSRKNSGQRHEMSLISTKQEDMTGIFSPRYGSSSIDPEAGLPPLELSEDKFNIFSPRLVPAEPEVFPETPRLSESFLDLESIFSPRIKEKEAANPFSIFSPRPSLETKSTFNVLLSNITAMKEEPFYKPADSSTCQKTFRSPRYSHVVSPSDLHSFNPSLRTGIDAFRLNSRLIHAN